MSGILSFKIARAELQVLPKAQNMEIKTIEDIDILYHKLYSFRNITGQSKYQYFRTLRYFSSYMLSEDHKSALSHIEDLRESYIDHILYDISRLKVTIERI